MSANARIPNVHAIERTALGVIHGTGVASGYVTALAVLAREVLNRVGVPMLRRSPDDAIRVVLLEELAARPPRDGKHAATSEAVVRAAREVVANVALDLLRNPPPFGTSHPRPPRSQPTPSGTATTPTPTAWQVAFTSETEADRLNEKLKQFRRR